jgi:osmotically-inducible protein OsmY
MGSFGGGMTQYGERGRFAGRGPKGWQRSDERIRDDINERLTDHPDIDATEIQVQVNQAEVTLTGSVEERRAKRLAEDIAESVAGVKDVHNQLHVEPQHAGAQSHEPGRK